eukprot:58495_1
MCWGNHDQEDHEDVDFVDLEAQTGKQPAPPDLDRVRSGSMSGSKLTSFAYVAGGLLSLVIALFVGYHVFVKNSHTLTNNGPNVDTDLSANVANSDAYEHIENVNGAQKAEVLKLHEVQIPELQPNPFLVHDLFSYKGAPYGGTLTMQYSPSILAELQKYKMLECIARIIAPGGTPTKFRYDKIMGAPHGEFLEFTFSRYLANVEPGTSTVDVEFQYKNKSGVHTILKLNKVPIVTDDKPLKV